MIEFGVTQQQVHNQLGVIVDIPLLARRLLKRGHSIMDIKPYPDNRAKTRFIFRKDESIMADITDILAENPKRR